jgi:hypothetical protein
MGLRDCRRGCLGFNLLTGYTSGHNTTHGNFFLWRWLIEPFDGQSPASGPIECRQRLGGLLRFYCRRAA